MKNVATFEDYRAYTMSMIFSIQDSGIDVNFTVRNYEYSRVCEICISDFYGKEGDGIIMEWIMQMEKSGAEISSDYGDECLCITAENAHGKEYTLEVHYHWALED